MYRAIPRCVFVFLGLVSVAGLFMVSVVAGKLFLMVSLVFDLLWFLSWQGMFCCSIVLCLWFPSLLILFMVSGCYRTEAVSPMETITKRHQDVSVTN